MIETLRRTNIWMPLAAAIVALGLGGITATSSILGEFTLGLITGTLIIFALPKNILLYGFLFLVLSGLRPLPSVLGYHIEAQYLLLPVMLVRSIFFTPVSNPIDCNEIQRPLKRATILVIAVSVISLGYEIIAKVPSMNIVIGDYLKWVMSFIFLLILLRSVRRTGIELAPKLSNNLVRIFFAFAIFTLIYNDLHVHSLSELASVRLNLPNAGPNRSGTMMDIGILFVVAPLIDRKWTMHGVLMAFVLAILLLLTGSRDALVSLVVGLIVLGFLAKGKRTWYFYTLASVTILIVIILMIGAKPPSTVTRAIDVSPQLAP